MRLSCSADSLRNCHDKMPCNHCICWLSFVVYVILKYANTNTDIVNTSPKLRPVTYDYVRRDVDRRRVGPSSICSLRNANAPIVKLDASIRNWTDSSLLQANLQYGHHLSSQGMLHSPQPRNKSSHPRRESRSC